MWHQYPNTTTEKHLADEMPPWQRVFEEDDDPGMQNPCDDNNRWQDDQLSHKSDKWVLVEKHQNLILAAVAFGLKIHRNRYGDCLNFDIDEMLDCWFCVDTGLEQ